MLLGDLVDLVILQKAIAKLAAHVTGGRKGHVDGNGSNAFAPLPGPNAVMVPINFCSVEDRVDMLLANLAYAHRLVLFPLPSTA